VKRCRYSCKRLSYSRSRYPLGTVRKRSQMRKSRFQQRTTACRSSLPDKRIRPDTALLHLTSIQQDSDFLQQRCILCTSRLLMN